MTHCSVETKLNVIILARYLSPQTQVSVNARKRMLDIMAEGWDQKEGGLLCFTLTGEEHMDALLFNPETYSQMLALHL